jgi:hypothetical protein
MQLTWRGHDQSLLGVAAFQTQLRRQPASAFLRAKKLDIGPAFGNRMTFARKFAENSLEETLMPKSRAVFLFASMVALFSTSAMAQVTTWEVSAVNDLGGPVNDIELTIAGTGGGITGPIAVNPNPVVFSSPPPGNELNASCVAPLNPGQPFIADFNLPTGLTPSLVGGNRTVNNVVVGPVNPALTSFAPVAVPEPGTMVLACFAAVGVAIVSLRRGKR